MAVRILVRDEAMGRGIDSKAHSHAYYFTPRYWYSPIHTLTTYTHTHTHTPTPRRARQLPQRFAYHTAYGSAWVLTEAHRLIERLRTDWLHLVKPGHVMSSITLPYPPAHAAPRSSLRLQVLANCCLLCTSVRASTAIVSSTSPICQVE